MCTRSRCLRAALITTLISIIAGPAVAGPPESAGESSSVNDRFNLELYRRVAAEPGNIFISPYSVADALAMTSAGGVGPTADEIFQVLALDPSLPKDPAQAAAKIAELLHAGDLLNSESRKGIQLESANAIWCSRSVHFKKSFVDVLTLDFRALCEGLDFAKQPDAALKRINDWVAKQTHDRIHDLVPRDAITPITALILTNAIYFKASWQHPFEPHRTRDMPFTVSGGTPHEVPTMMNTDVFGYAKLDGYSVLEMPYKGGRMSMVILLPDDSQGLPAFEKSLSTERLKTSLAGLKRQKVFVSLPRFRSETTYEMSSALKDMGIKTAFTESADFSGITSDVPLYIAKVIHKAFVDVNETGTEAAAATAVIMEAGSARPNPIPKFVADHAFIYLIRDLAHDQILFMGRLADPRK